MEFITYFAVGEEELRQIVRLIVLMIPLFILPMLLKSSNSLIGKIGNVADNISRQVGIEKGASGMRSGAGGMIKNRALNTEARMARRGGALGAVGGYRTRRKFKLDNQNRERQRAQSEALNKYMTSPSSENFQKRAAGIGGAAKYGGIGRVEAMFAGEQQKRIQEETNNARAVMVNDKDFGHDSLGVAKRYLQNAHNQGDVAGVRAALGVLSSAEPGVDMVKSFVKENESTMSSEQRQAISAGINDNWTNFKSRDHTVSTWSSAYDDKGSLYPTLEAAGNSNPYKGLNAEQLSTQTMDALKYAQSKNQITPRMASAVLESEASKNLSNDKRLIFENIASLAAQNVPQTESNSATGSNRFDEQSAGGVWTPRK